MLKDFFSKLEAVKQRPIFGVIELEQQCPSDTLIFLASGPSYVDVGRTEAAIHDPAVECVTRVCQWIATKSLISSRKYKSK